MGAWPRVWRTLYKVLTQGPLPPWLGHMAVVRGDRGSFLWGLPRHPARSSVRCAPVFLPQLGEQASLLGRGQPLYVVWAPSCNRTPVTGTWAGSQAPAVSATRSTPSPETVPWGQGRGVWAPTHPGCGVQPGCPCKRHTGTSQQERLGSPKSPGRGAAGSRGEVSSRSRVPAGRLCPQP